MQKTLPRLFPRAALTGCLVGGVISALAQTTPASSPTPPAGEVIVLSPFRIDADDQNGYLARSTTSGNRLRTDLKDLGAQIDVFSKEFLDDIGATDPEEAFLYSLNVENEQENPDYGDGNRARFERSGPAATARGLGNSRTTGITTGRDFFATTVRLHNYNTENLSISSGPNSILFGLGQAGGTVSASLKRAETHRNRSSLGLRWDSNGTKMGTLDVNQVLIKDRLAVRIAALENREESYMRGNYDYQTRYYGAITAQPADWLNLRLHFEHVDETESPTQYRQFQDNISPWFIDGNARPYDPDVDGNARPRYLVNDSGRETLLIASDGTIDTTTVGITKWNSRFNARSEETFNYIEYASENGLTSSPFYDPGFLDTLDDRRVTFSPETLKLLGLPFKDVNPWGDTMRRIRSGEIVTAFAEFNPLKDLFIELGYNREQMDQRQYGYNRSFNYGVFVDAAARLPNGAPNPNVGQLFMQDEGWAWETPTREQEFRALASYEFDFDRLGSLSKRWTGLLGRHRLAGFFSQRDTSEIRANSFQMWKQNSDGTTPSFLQGASTNVTDPNGSWLNNGDRRVSVRHYLTPDNNYQLQLIRDWAPGAELLTLPDPGRSGSLLQASLFDPEVGSNRLFSFDRHVESLMFAYQGYFWDDRVILTYGKRTDDVKERDLRGAGDRIQNYTDAQVTAGDIPPWVIRGGWFPWYTELDWNDYGATNQNINESKGLVFRPIGVADWLTLHYNEGSNNSAGTIRFDADGGRHNPITGTGRDWGVRFDLLDNRLAFKINQYETDSQNVETGGGAVDGDVRGVFRNLETRFYEVDPGRFTVDGFDIFGQTDLFLPVADKKAKGTEFTLIAQPTRNWNIRATLAKTESVLGNIATSYIEWGDARASFWADAQWNEEDLDGTYKPVVGWMPNPEVGAAPTYDQLLAAGFTRIDPTTNALLRDDNGDIAVFRTKLGTPGVDTPIAGWNNIAFGAENNSETLFDYYQRAYLINVKSRIEQLNGVSAPNVRKWRGNLSSSYQFSEGRLKGLRVGGSVRYREAGIVGYGRKTVGTGADAITVLDLANPYTNDDEIFLDAFLAYRGTLFGDVDYRVQLNVRNLLDNSDLYVTDRSTTGRNLVWAGYEPRTYVLSLDLEF